MTLKRAFFSTTLFCTIAYWWIGISICSNIVHATAQGQLSANKSFAAAIAKSLQAKAKHDPHLQSIIDGLQKHQQQQLQQIAVQGLDEQNSSKDIKYPSCYNGSVEFTQYWVPRENDWDEDQKGRRIFLGGKQPKVPILGDQNQTLAMVPKNLFEKCTMEGTCLLENGDLINLSPDTDDAFRLIGRQDRQHNLFGLGFEKQNLVPFVSVAANDLPQGTTLYLQDLDGMELPSGAKHNGCLRVDDVAWSFDECHVDLFVVSYVDYLSLDFNDNVSFEIKSCTVQNYVTADHLAFLGANTSDDVIRHAMNDTFTE